LHYSEQQAIYKASPGGSLGFEVGSCAQNIRFGKCAVPPDLNAPQPAPSTPPTEEEVVE
jgi:hypothetical protein